MAHISNVLHDCRWLDGMSGTILNPVNLFRVFAWSEGKPCVPHDKLYIVNKKTVKNRKNKDSIVTVCILGSFPPVGEVCICL